MFFKADQVKYLEVVFQRMGRTHRHVDHNVRNASRALNVIKVQTQPCLVRDRYCRLWTKAARHQDGEGGGV